MNRDFHYFLLLGQVPLPHFSNKKDTVVFNYHMKSTSQLPETRSYFFTFSVAHLLILG